MVEKDFQNETVLTAAIWREKLWKFCSWKIRENLTVARQLQFDEKNHWKSLNVGNVEKKTFWKIVNLLMALSASFS